MAFFRPIVGFLSLVLVSGSLFAQTGEDVLHHDDAAGICGLELFGPSDPVHVHAVATLVSDPVRRARAMEIAKANGRHSLAAIGDVNTFYVLNRVSQDFDAITSVLKYDGRLARVWIDVADTARVSKNVLAQLVRGLDSITGSTSRDPSKSIIQNDIDVFGETPKTYEVDGKTDFLMTDIKDGLGAGGYVAGYFSQYDQSNDPGSNARNILYIDSREGLASGTNSLLNTIAHEFQHLIQYNVNPGSEVFFNEGCSEVASILCGYKTRGNTGFMANTNVRFLGWNYTDTQLLLSDYERAMTFVYYLYDQFGEAFLREFTQTTTTGVPRIDRALQTLGISSTFQEVLKGFAVANSVLTGLTDDRYRYDVRLTNSTPKAASTYDTLLPAAGSVTLQSFASSYLLLTNPSTVSVQFTSTRTFRVMAIIYRANVADEVVELEGGTPYLLNGDRTATKILFSIVSLNGSSTTVNWSASEGPAGVDDQAEHHGLAVSLVPQPVIDGRGYLSISTPAASRVTAMLYDQTGRLLRTIVDHEYMAEGENRFAVDLAGIPAGTYVVHLTMPDAVVTRRLVVVR